MSGYGEIIEPRTVRFERLLPGPIELVWQFLTDSDKRAVWLASGTMEPRVGSKCSFTYDNENLSPDKTPPSERNKGRGRAISHHTITRFEPPRFLGITWGDETNPSQVDFELKPEGDEVRLILIHKMLPSRASMLSVGPGWHTHLDFLTDRMREQSSPAFWTRFEGLESYYEAHVPPDAPTR